MGKNIKISRAKGQGPISIPQLIREWQAKNNNASKNYEIAESFGVHPTYFSLMMRNDTSLFRDWHLEVLSMTIGVSVHDLVIVRYEYDRWRRINVAA